MATTLEAIKSLVQAGRGSEVREVLDSAARAAKGDYDHIRSQTEYTEEARREMAARAYDTRRKGVDEKLGTMAGQAGYSDRDDVARAFGTAGLPGDAASLAISMRDARDRVGQINKRDELLDLVRRSTRNGDEVLARAAAGRAMELEYSDVLRAFLDTRPALDPVVERIWKAQKADFNSFDWTLQLSALKPPRL
ncbi:hypothetical protein ACFQ8T_12555 [Isoptericola sp. NPDC056618]|uniref:hypothetical protein n=1 Tax=Isoptericola sp. NPDC056618 TaxID=3345878 RepID=UPI00369D6973